MLVPPGRPCVGVPGSSYLVAPCMGLNERGAHGSHSVERLAHVLRASRSKRGGVSFRTLTGLPDRETLFPKPEFRSA